MNLLQVQDTLKNASDQQLMALMQAPDSTAPSYLVLSEIRRRKDMRAKQTPDSNRTVAEELTAPQEPAGIQALQGQAPQGPMEPDGTDAAQGMAAGGLASLRRYQEGGVVRMQEGGNVPRRPLSEMSQADLNMIGRHFNFGDFQGGRFSGARPLGRPQYSLEEFQAEVFRRQNLNRPNELRRFIEDPESAFANRSPDQVNTQPIAMPGGPLGNAPAAPAAGQPSASISDPYADQLPTSDEDVLGAPPPRAQSAPAAAPSGGAAAGAGAPASQTAGGAAASPPPAARQESAAGIRSLAPAAGVAAPQEPNLADIMRRTGELFPDNMSGIRDRMREDRVDPAARRSEAVNMALIEAGLRIAGSRNPSLIGAIGEGALPAVQSYGQQLNQIRGEQRQSRQDELELAKQEVTRQFAIGQISSAEYRSRMENINANARIAAQERGANARLAASEAGAERRTTAAAAAAEEADLRRGYASPGRLARMSPEERTAFERIRTLSRPLDTSGASSALNATLQDINRIGTQIENLGPRPAPSSRSFAEWELNNSSLQQRLRDAEARRRQLEDIVVYGRSRDGTEGRAQTGTGSTNRPSVEISTFQR